MPPPLRRSEQIVSALLLILGLAGIGYFVWNQLQSKSQLINVDEATRFGNVFAVDINRATVDELAILPGIGPKLAREIVDFRTANGPLSRPEDLLNVPGIGPQKLEAIRSFLAPMSEAFFNPLNPER